VLEVKGIHTFYGNVAAVRDASLSVRERELVALIGANGAGKTTTLKTIVGLMRPRQGTVIFDGQPITGRPAPDIVRKGLIMVPQGRRVFPRMTVMENLELGGYTSPTRQERARKIEEICERFPVLGERAGQLAGSLSGGEQQMLAIGRALMAAPRLLVLDEPSLGLAPMLVEEVFEIIVNICESGTPILLVEQNAHQALEIATRGYVMQTGTIVMEGTGQELLANPDVRRRYLGD